MKLYKGIIYSLSAVAFLTGCSMEETFQNGTTKSTGTLMTKCLAPKWGNTEGINISTRAGVPSTDDFNVVISRKSNARAAAQGSVEYKYGDMPEVLTLPVGEYKVYAHHGENKPAEWDSPYYYGESEFSIDANKITDNVDPIVAKLSNIRVTIVFSASLLSAMSPDSKVEVRVGDQGVMEFTQSETRSAYFKHVNKSQSLTATFTGTVDGSEVVETEGYDNVAPGNHYRITFRMHGIDEDDPGTVTVGVTVDASVETINMNQTVDGEKEEYLDDDMRPQQGDGKDPGPGPDDPIPPVTDKSAPKVEALTPSGDQAGFDKIDFDKVNEVTDHLYCAWKIISEAEGGFTEFTVDIDSGTLTPEELEGVGVADHLDLINPGEFNDALVGLGFPTGIGGAKEAEFDITGFLSLMAILGEANHEFKMTVTDANGTSVFLLRLHTN